MNSVRRKQIPLRLKRHSKMKFSAWTSLLSGFHADSLVIRNLPHSETSLNVFKLSVTPEKSIQSKKRKLLFRRIWLMEMKRCCDGASLWLSLWLFKRNLWGLTVVQIIRPILFNYQITSVKTFFFVCARKSLLFAVSFHCVTTAGSAAYASSATNIQLKPPAWNAFKMPWDTAQNRYLWL